MLWYVRLVADRSPRISSSLLRAAATDCATPTCRCNDAWLWPAASAAAMNIEPFYAVLVFVFLSRSFCLSPLRLLPYPRNKDCGYTSRITTSTCSMSAIFEIWIRSVFFLRLYTNTITKWNITLVDYSSKTIKFFSLLLHFYSVQHFRAVYGRRNLSCVIAV